MSSYPDGGCRNHMGVARLMRCAGLIIILGGGEGGGGGGGGGYVC